MTYTFRPLGPDDLDQAWALDEQIFNTDGSGRDGFEAQSPPDRFHGAFDAKGRLVATSRVIPFRQYFGGRAVTTGGLSSVAVAPEGRGKGLGFATCQAALGDMRSRGEGLSTLLPATSGLYRKLGWELAGAYVLRDVPCESLRRLPVPRDRRIERAEPGDRAAIRACHERVAPTIDGFIERPDSRWHWLEHHFDDFYVYLSRSAAGEVDGYLAYRQIGGGEDFTMRVHDWIAESRTAAASLFWTLGSTSTVASQVRYVSSPEDALLLLVDRQAEEVFADVRFMARIIDPAQAVAERGFARSLDLEATVVLEETAAEGPAAALAANAGAWRLSVSKGEGRLERVGDDAEGAVRMGVGAFASLYTGWARTSGLERMGLLTGGSPEERERLDAAFAGPTPWLPEEF